MKRIVFSLVLIFLIVGVLLGIRYTGNVVYDDPHSGGIPQGEIECMQNCIYREGCRIGDVDCPAASACQAECNAYQPTDLTDGEQCVQDCIDLKCEGWDAECQNSFIDECDVECGMKGDAPEWETMSEEEKCISVCVAEVDPTIICGSSSEGETGNEVCQRCAAECVYLYEGPCLTDEELEEKERACETCEHCYGSPVMGDSGEGYECIVDIECLDASSEFGDEPGSEEDENLEPTRLFDGIVNFFKGLFE